MEIEEMNSPEASYIDLHCHLVAGVDDGAATENETQHMLELARNDGIGTIVATPHLFSSHSSEKDPAVVFEKVEALVQACSAPDAPVKVVPGAEVFFDSNLFDYLMEFKHHLTLNHSSYFLLEFPFNFIFHGASDFMYRVMMEGLIPVIAHVERNSVMQRNPRLVYEMAQMGVLCQVNAASFDGYFGEVAEDTARLLLKHNLVHVIASDAHSATERRPEFSSTIARLESEGFQQAGMLAADVPHAIIHDEGVPDTGVAEDPSRQKSIFDFFRKKFK